MRDLYCKTVKVLSGKQVMQFWSQVSFLLAFVNISAFILTFKFQVYYEQLLESAQHHEPTVALVTFEINGPPRLSISTRWQCLKGQQC